MLIDIRDRVAFRRGHKAGALNLPADELSHRIETEIGENVTVAVDFAGIQQATCDAAATELMNRHRHVILLTDDDGRFGA